MIASTASRPQCTVRLTGGLGNQLFQYAAGRSLSLRHNTRLVLDVSFFNARRHRQFELDQFPIAADLLPLRPLNRFTTSCRRLWSCWGKSWHVYQEPHFHYDQDFIGLPATVTLKGYFQSERYFNDFAATIRSELTPPQPADPDWQRWGHRIAAERATALHVRRGDYVASKKASQIYHACGIDYYRRAMERCPCDGPVYVFSDDLDWARENLPPLRPLVFPDGPANRSGLTDLWLMTRAHHHIIANSTFSWWGAYLANANKGITIAPRRWFQDESIDDRDLIPTSWQRV